MKFENAFFPEIEVITSWNPVDWQEHKLWIAYVYVSAGEDAKEDLQHKADQIF
jgi:hypothetical protein